MTARPPFDPAAGEWIVGHTWIREHDGVTRWAWLMRLDGMSTSWTVTPSDALRFDTQAEARRVMRQLLPRRMSPGNVKNVMRASEAPS